MSKNYVYRFEMTEWTARNVFRMVGVPAEDVQAMTLSAGSDGRIMVYLESDKDIPTEVLDYDRENSIPF